MDALHFNNPPDGYHRACPHRPPGAGMLPTPRFGHAHPILRNRRHGPAACGVVLGLLFGTTSAFAQSSKGRISCKDFPTYQDAVAFCMARYGTTTECGGLDRDRDGLPCECNSGGPEANERACVNWRKENQ